MKEVYLSSRLEIKYAFGSIVIGLPDTLGRAGCSGLSIVWLNPGEETYGMHAEGAAGTRHAEAVDVLERWESLVITLQSLGNTDEARTVALGKISELERFILSIPRSRPAEGFSALFDLARNVVSNKAETKVSDVTFKAKSDAAAPGGWMARLMEAGYKVTYRPGRFGDAEYLVKFGGESVKFVTNSTRARSTVVAEATAGQQAILDAIAKSGLAVGSPDPYAEQSYAG